MGSLKPGATYIYERADGVTYAREFGADPSERKIIGYEYKDVKVSGQNELDAHNLWIQIRLAGKKNPALQKAIENVILLYHLSKDQINGTK